MNPGPGTTSINSGDHSATISAFDRLRSRSSRRLPCDARVRGCGSQGTGHSLTTVRGDQKASVEVKIADSWSVRELETALRNQLVGQYLRHEKGRAGCL